MRFLIFDGTISQGFWDTEGGWVARIHQHYDKFHLEDLRNSDEPTLLLMTRKLIL